MLCPSMIHVGLYSPSGYTLGIEISPQSPAGMHGMLGLKRFIFSVILIFFFSLLAQAEDPPSHEEVMADDSTLLDVEFFDRDHGWAVGQRGLILQTNDGGKHWQRVASTTQSTLYSVSFIDQRNGWAVGGSTHPYTHSTKGLVLTTRDGGASWEPVLKSPLPLLKMVKFFDSKHGVAAGVGSDLYPAGLFETVDGGQSWRPLPSNEPKTWLAGDLLRTRDHTLSGALVGPRSASATIAGREVRDSVGVRDLRGRNALKMIDSASGWLVGDGSLIRITRDGGTTWRAPTTELPDQFSDWFDWLAIETHGPHVWIAGSPGSIILHSHDKGATWSSSPTGCSTPLRAITFVDDQNGWAVGEFGVIHQTNDGGQTWHPQRGADRRAAIAWVLGASSSLPAELVAINAAGEGRRSVISNLFAPEPSLAAESEWRRLEEAALACGTNAADHDWQLVLNSSQHNLSTDALVEILNDRTDGLALEHLARRLHRMFLTYRPSVIALPEASQSEEMRGLNTLLLEALQGAMAQSESVPPEFTGLATWQPQRIVAYQPAQKRSQFSENRVATGDFSSRLAATPAQWARPARALLAKQYMAGPAAYRWRTLSGSTAPTNRHGDLTAGLDLRLHGSAARPSFLPAQGRLEELKRLAQKQRNMERLMQQSEGDPAWAGQVIDLTGGLDPEAGSGLLMQLAESYRETGKIDLAADTLYLLARRYPNSPPADASLTWLIRHYASGERAHVATMTVAQQARSNDTLSNITSPSLPLAASSSERPEVELSAEDRYERAAKLCEFLKNSRPEMYADPSLRFSAAASQRSRGFGKDAERTALLLSKQSIAESWRLAAQAERWLAEPEGLPPEKPIVMCRQTKRRPKLDGLLNEACWKQAEPLRLEQNSETLATVRLARDHAFLYVATQAFGADPSHGGQEPTSRPRDADLRLQDRIRLRIDIDRDYTTAYELTVDSRGWTHESLWSDRHWNPTWYVASAETMIDGQPTWVVEAAIPLSELVDPEQLQRAAWAISAERLQPGKEPIHWTGDSSSPDTPDAFGLLLFD